MVPCIFAEAFEKTEQYEICLHFNRKCCFIEWIWFHSVSIKCLKMFFVVEHKSHDNSYAPYRRFLALVQSECFKYLTLFIKSAAESDGNDLYKP